MEVSKVQASEFGLELSTAQAIESAFLPKITEREALSIIYNQVISKELNEETYSQARELRLKLVKVRTGIADIHKTQKATALAYGKFCDAFKNSETLPVEQMEEKLMEIEKHKENIEKECIAKLEKERAELIAPFYESHVDGLGIMNEDSFNALLLVYKTAFEAKKEAERIENENKLRLELIAKLHEERKNKTIRLVQFIDNYEVLQFGELSESDFMSIVNLAIEKRTAAEAEQERIKKELEAAKLEAERKEKELESERKKQADLLAKQQAEQEKQNAIIAAQQKEIQDRKDAEIAELAKRNAEILEKQRAAEKAAKAPLKEKLNLWVNSFELPTFENDVIANEIKIKFDLFKKWAESEISKL